MIAVLKAMPDMFKVSFASLVAYRAEMTIWILTATLPFIMLALWNAVVQDGAIAGFGAPEFARYFVATLITRQLTSSWLIFVLNFEIRTGKLSGRLLRPLHPLWWFGAQMLSAMPFRLAVLTPLVGLLVLWKPDLWQFPEPLALLLFGVSVFLAWLMGFLVQAAFATLSFWLDKTDGLFGMWFSLWMVFSGYIAPLAVFPEWSQDLLWWLPFRSMLAVPVEILGGFLTWREALDDVALQLGWTAAIAALVSVLWRAGIRRYGAYGA